MSDEKTSVFEDDVTVKDPGHVLARDTVHELKALCAEMGFGAVESAYEDGTLQLTFKHYTGPIPGSEAEREDQVEQPLRRSLQAVFAADTINLQAQAIDRGYLTASLSRTASE